MTPQLNLDAAVAAFVVVVVVVLDLEVLAEVEDAAASAVVGAITFFFSVNSCVGCWIPVAPASVKVGSLAHSVGQP